MKCFIFLLVAILSFTMTVEAEEFGGVEFPQGENSFADSVVVYAVGSYAAAPYITASDILGIPDYPSSLPSKGAVSLGNGGTIIIRFTDNSLTTSGTADLDLWVFEGGTIVESTDVYISKDGVEWISVGQIKGSISGVDIDAYIGSGVIVGDSYSYVKLTDVEDDDFGTQKYAGADIDAVGAISSTSPVKTDNCSAWDINDNEKVDMPDVIYGLQLLAGLRYKYKLTECTGTGINDHCIPNCDTGWNLVSDTPISSGEYWTHIGLCTNSPSARYKLTECTGTGTNDHCTPNCGTELTVASDIPVSSLEYWTHIGLCTTLSASEYKLTECTGSGTDDHCTPDCGSGWNLISETPVSSGSYWTHIGLCGKN